MTDDFTIYQGVDIIPYIVVTSDGTEFGDPVALDTWTAATWAAFLAPYTGPTQTPAILKHKANMTIGPDPLVSPPLAINNCIFTPLSSQDVGASAEIGQFRYECRITLGVKQYVIYPAVGLQATFSIDASLTWNPLATPSPAPRLVRLEGLPRVEPPVSATKEEISNELKTELKNTPKAPSYEHRNSKIRKNS